ncbi:MAG: site-specific DNA-methyltransferase [Candidatus Shapirobacteria bacterium]|jgi:adenine-specific DNA-methyltransferase|nr:site-specific DNA-methyltransferase [Candidatus Paceibacterota bacterium]MDD5481953.1 site-specific DNA-methyltransferase [Candidatus Shapirobacteria bacterium]
MARKINYDDWSKEELIKELRRIKETKYGLVWHRDLPEEKIDILINPDARTPNEMFPNEMAGKPFPILKEVKTKEVNNDKGKPINLLIEGDNYHSLAVLNFTHQEAVDLIYIDPPYNRGVKGGNDFRYNDKFVDSEDPFRHSKWLSFMEKRLKLAKNLLKPTGAIFISIDNTEQAPLRLLCDEIFGEKNYVGTLIWRKKEGGGQADSYFVTEHEYILVYAKSEEFKWIDEEIPVDEAQFNKKDEGGKFTAVKLAKWGNTARREDRPKMYFPIKSPDGKNVYPIAPDGSDGRWRVGKKRMEMLIERGLVYWQKKNDKWIPYEKIYFDEEDVKKIKERSILYDLATTADGTNELTDIFGKKDIFENPKPTELIKFFLRFAAGNNAIVLDFFAGSGTTGQAVMALNSEDEGKRQFILCTNDENKICTEVCYPRLKKVIKGYKNSKGEKVAGLGGNLKYYTCDFVEAEPTDRNKWKLVSESTEMLCIRENAFELVQDESDFKIFKNNDKYLGIVFYEEAIDDFKKAIKKIKGHFNTYVFSLGDDPHEKQFADVKRKVTLCAIPEVILKVYREIFK